ncbi:MAG: TIGR03960 family B12-binding radical SAM protein [Limnochordia bacterium]|jgi:radical SAM family uncharacterized protein
MCQLRTELHTQVLPAVSRPARYLGNEYNSIRKDWAEVPLKMALAFPDVYDVGMGHLGLKILYHIINQREDALAERVFAPWTDMEEELVQRGLPLFSLESCRPLGDFHLIGFTLQYELSYSNILNMLHLAGIPPLARDRDDSHPIIIAGGPCAYNPEPLADFIDLFAIGEGEFLIDELLDLALGLLHSDRVPRDEYLLEAARRIRGIYVPAFYDVEYHADGRVAKIRPNRTGIPPRVRKQVVEDLDAAPYPDAFVVPYIDAIHDRATLEVFRGCTRGCRFCQAGMIYRPVRERQAATLHRQAEELIKNTGYEELALSSLSTGDYTCIEDLAADLMGRYRDQGVALSLPSLRVDSFKGELAEEIRKMRKTSLTFAPEAGTQRLRDVVNKNITEEDLLRGVEAAFAAGWDGVKLYFMLGLPTETEEDVVGIIELANKVLEAARRHRKGPRLKLSLSVSSFVPKSHTPFQWEPQAAMDVLEERQRLLTQGITRRRIELSWHDVRTSFLEAVFARGDRRLGRVLAKAAAAGCRFDGWSEHFSFDKWSQAFAECDLDPTFYAKRRRDYEEVLPWSHIDAGVTKGFLMREHKRALKGQLTGDCRVEECPGCGVCTRLGVAKRIVGD